MKILAIICIAIFAFEVCYNLLALIFRSHDCDEGLKMSYANAFLGWFCALMGAITILNLT